MFELGVFFLILGTISAIMIFQRSNRWNNWIKQGRMEELRSLRPQYMARGRYLLIVFAVSLTIGIFLTR